MARLDKSNQLKVRLTKAQDQEFSMLAAQFGLSKSDAFRRAVLAALGDGPVLPLKNQVEFLQIAEEMRAIGVNVNQAVRAMNTGRVPDDEALRGDLNDLRLGMEALAEVLVVMAASAKRKVHVAFTKELVDV